jgi:hypothetical protein
VKAVQPNQCALDDPTPAAKPFARIDAVSRNPRCDAPTA